MLLFPLGLFTIPNFVPLLTTIFTTSQRRPAASVIMAAETVSIVRLVIFLILAPLATFCLFKHGKRGVVAWLYLSLFCMLRIITGAMGIHSTNGALAPTILNSIGLAPVMYCAAGILHEAYVHTTPPPPPASSS